MKFIIWKLLRNKCFFLNIFLYIINITYIDINNKLKIKPKPISDIPKESKHETKWWFENWKLNVETENKIINGETKNIIGCGF